MAGLILVTVAIISTLGRPAPGKYPSPASIETPAAQPGGLPYPAIGDNPPAQTASYLITQKAIFLATDLAVTRTPYDTPVILPTGTSEDYHNQYTGEKLGLDTRNAWFGYSDGVGVTIYAGALLNDPDQGAIHLFVWFPGRIIEAQLLTPTRNGGVRVVSEQNNRLTLVADDGATFYFDVPARRFVATLTEIVPTATPPYPYPYPSPP